MANPMMLMREWLPFEKEVVFFSYPRVSNSDLASHLAVFDLIHTYLFFSFYIH